MFSFFLKRKINQFHLPRPELCLRWDSQYIGKQKLWDNLWAAMMRCLMKMTGSGIAMTIQLDRYRYGCVYSSLLATLSVALSYSIDGKAGSTWTLHTSVSSLWQQLVSFFGSIKHFFFFFYFVVTSNPNLNEKRRIFDKNSFQQLDLKFNFFLRNEIGKRSWIWNCNLHKNFIFEYFRAFLSISLACECWK